MAENPSDYDKLQDGRLDSLESLVTAEYQPPAGTEYSYPVSNQGITQDQFRNMMRGLGKGTITQHDADTARNSYRLVDHGSDSETNQRNTLILRPATNTGHAETASNGFFHVLTDDMELPFPAVTSSTTYHVTVTYDPRLFKTTPLKIEVYPGEPPTTYGRDHIVLFKVRREPNQLLSQATRTPVNQWLGNVINVWSEENLPDPTHVEYGTMVVVINSKEGDGGLPELYTSRGVLGWVPIKENPKKYDITLRNGWEVYASFGLFRATLKDGWVTLQGVMRNGAWTESRFASLPAPLHPRRSRLLYGFNTYSGTLIDVRVGQNGDMTFGNPTGTRPSWITFDGVSYPLD